MPETQIQSIPPQKHLHPGIWVTVLVLFAAATGYFFWASQSQEWPKGEFQDWQTYRNQEYEFEFKYPKGWAVEGDQNGAIPIVLAVTPPRAFQLSYKLEYLSIDPLDSGESLGNPGCEIKDTLFSGRAAKECVQVSPSTKRYIRAVRIVNLSGLNWSKNNGIVFLIEQSNPHYSELLSTFDQILSTFRFVE